MTGLWLASYLVLWGLVVVICLLLIGILRQLGLTQRQLESHLPQLSEEGSIPALEHDGPGLGSPLADLKVGTINGFGTVSAVTQHGNRTLLLVFMSPMCETCQHIVDPLNALVEDAVHTLRAAVIMRGDEQACQAFLSVFPLHMPVVCDHDRTITMGLGIHRTPFGLLYDEHGILIRKGVLEGQEDILALLGDGSVSDTAKAHVFP
jgi:methylamine dehydrogenase accessory protein MauD